MNSTISVSVSRMLSRQCRCASTTTQADRERCTSHLASFKGGFKWHTPLAWAFLKAVNVNAMKPGRQRMWRRMDAGARIASVEMPQLLTQLGKSTALTHGAALRSVQYCHACVVHHLCPTHGRASMRVYVVHRVFDKLGMTRLAEPSLGAKEGRKQAYYHTRS